MSIKIAIFASGNGSNAENIIRFFQADDCGIEVAVVVCNRPNAGVVQRAFELNVPVILITKELINDDDLIFQLLDSFGVDFIILAGFLLLVPASIIKRYPNKILNIHPSLLPRHGGKGMYDGKVHEAVVRSSDTETGITIHLVNEIYDNGSVVFQAKVPVLSTDTPCDVERKVRQLELTHYPVAIKQYIKSH